MMEDEKYRGVLYWFIAVLVGLGLIALGQNFAHGIDLSGSGGFGLGLTFTGEIVLFICFALLLRYLYSAQR
jgi:hypothetical protein